MRFSRLGNSGLVVSKLAFGAMTLGDSWAGPLSAITGSEADRLVGESIDHGINFFDTADMYHDGQSEILLGKALASRRREAIIATKAGMRTDKGLANAGLSARHLHASIDASLSRLDTGWVDVYICHRPDPLTPLEETLAALDVIVRSGKARYIGFSNWPAWLAAKAIEMQKANGWARFITGQMYYSLIARDIEQEYVPMALDAGVGTMIWSPLSSGFLSGKYTREQPDGGGGRLNDMDLLPFDRERGYAIIDALRLIAEARETSVAAIALAWLLDRPTICTAILGFTSAAQFKTNLAAADLLLSTEESAALDSVSAQTAHYPQNFLARFLSDPLVKAAEGIDRR